MNLNFYNPSASGPSIDDLQKALQDQLSELQKLKNYQINGNSLQQPNINNLPIDQQLNAIKNINNKQINPPNNTSDDFYNNFRNLKNWNLFLETVYGVTDDQMLADYKLFNKALAEIEENESQQKLNDMKDKLKSKTRKINNVSNTNKRSDAANGELDASTNSSTDKINKRGGKENVQ